MVNKVGLLLGLVVFAGACNQQKIRQTSPEQEKIEAEVEYINQLRETLVHGVNSETNVDVETFKSVCSPVGLKIKERANVLGVSIRQVSLKNRNPDNAPTEFEKEGIAQLTSSSEKENLWIEKKTTQHYFRKIEVKKACLNCHGEKEKRPAFIKTAYPEDRAYGFTEGDLRGVYHVRIEK